MSDASAYASSDGESRAAQAYGLYASTEARGALVAEVVGYKNAASAVNSARNHARNNSLKWPLREPSDTCTPKSGLSVDESVAPHPGRETLREAAKAAGLSHQRVGQIWKKTTGSRYVTGTVRSGSAYTAAGTLSRPRATGARAAGTRTAHPAAISDGVLATERSLEAKQKQALAYDAYARRGRTWRDVMEMVGAKHPQDARHLARVHAARNGLRWPLRSTR